MGLKFDVDPASRSLNGSIAFLIYIIGDMVSAGFKTAQFDRPGPPAAAIGREERVIHPSVFCDGIGLGNVIAVRVEVEEHAAGKHPRVVDVDPLFPVGFLSGCQDRLLELPPIRPDELRSDYSS